MKQVLCSSAMVERIKPTKQSKFVDRFGEKVCAAEYDIDIIENISDEEYEKQENVWRRCCDWAVIPVNISDRKLKEIKKDKNWFFWYICDKFGASTEKNVTAILTECANQKWLSLIDFVDKFL